MESLFSLNDVTGVVLQQHLSVKAAAEHVGYNEQ